MSAYRRVWLGGCFLLGGLGAAAGATALPVELLIPLMLLAVTAALTVAIDRDHSRRGFEPRRSGHWLRVTAIAWGIWLAVLGLGQLLGVGFFFLLLGIAVSSPRALRWYVARGGQLSADGYEYAAISTARLCREWQASYVALQQATTTAARLRITATRQRCLDELELRDPKGFDAWMGSAASPGGSPRRFITDAPCDRPGPDG